jgi:hypothetical protein
MLKFTNLVCVGVSGRKSACESSSFLHLLASNGHEGLNEVLC